MVEQPAHPPHSVCTSFFPSVKTRVCECGEWHLQQPRANATVSDMRVVCCWLNHCRTRLGLSLLPRTPAGAGSPAALAPASPPPKSQHHRPTSPWRIAAAIGLRLKHTYARVLQRNYNSQQAQGPASLAAERGVQALHSGALLARHHRPSPRTSAHGDQPSGSSAHRPIVSQHGTRSLATPGERLAAAGRPPHRHRSHRSPRSASSRLGS